MTATIHVRDPRIDGSWIDSVFLSYSLLSRCSERSTHVGELTVHARIASEMVMRPDSSTFTFGDFQLDCRVPELKKRGRTVRIPQQSIQILSLLLAAAGEVVTR